MIAEIPFIIDCGRCGNGQAGIVCGVTASPQSISADAWANGGNRYANSGATGKGKKCNTNRILVTNYTCHSKIIKIL